MNRKLRLSLIVAIATVALVATGTAEAADKTDVQLTLMDDGSGALAISVDPENAQIWRNKPDKPKKVYWYTANETSYDELSWELRYDPSKGGGTADYFGAVDIECGKDSIKVQPDKKPDAPHAEWPYSVAVYSCVDGARGDLLAEVDPRIVWKD
jgi:hypothetical protein